MIEGWLRTRGQRRSGDLHVNDLLHCRRKVAFERLDENPPTIDERKLHHFINGEIRHLYLQELLGSGFEVEKKVTYITPNGIKIIGHVDAYHTETRTVVEFKNTESVKVLKEPYSYHLSQLMMYISILGSERGILQYLIIGASHRLKNYFPEYSIIMTSDQRHDILERIDEYATELKTALDNKDPNLAEPVFDSLTYLNGSSNWYCESCPYKKSCLGYKEFFEGKTSDEIEREAIEKAIAKLKQSASFDRQLTEAPSQ